MSLDFHRIAEVDKSGQRAVLVTVITSQGSTPRKGGARMLVFADGHSEGSVGGGALEHRAQALAMARMGAAESSLESFALEKDLHMACGGQVQLFFEPLGSTPSLILFGGGHINHVVAQLATQMGFLLTVLDDRPEIVSAERYPTAAERIPSFANEAVEDLVFDDNTYVVIATYQHSRDGHCLRQVIDKPARFIGLMGSRRKAAVLRQKLAQEGYSQERIARVQVPVGLPIGAETPEEIALSVVAELVRQRRDVSGVGGGVRGGRKTYRAALVAAAGDSTRMGQPKALLNLDGEPLVLRLVRTLVASGAVPCIVTVPEGEVGAQIRQVLQGTGAVVSLNTQAQLGLIGSIRSALDLLGDQAEALLVSPVDAPFIDVDGAQRLFAAAGKQAIAVPQVGEKQGHPVVFGQSFFAALRAGAADHGAQNVVQQAGPALKQVPLDDPRLCAELNTPEDAASLGIALN